MARGIFKAKGLLKNLISEDPDSRKKIRPTALVEKILKEGTIEEFVTKAHEDGLVSDEEWRVMVVDKRDLQEILAQKGMDGVMDKIAICAEVFYRLGLIWIDEPPT